MIIYSGKIGLLISILLNFFINSNIILNVHNNIIERSIIVEINFSKINALLLL